MDRVQFDSVKSVLRDLTLGKRPRVDDLPTLLNLHQGRFVEADDNRVMVYFHPNVVHVPNLEEQKPGNQSQPAVVEILEQAKQDLKRRWFVLRKTYRAASDQQQTPDAVEYGTYRFLFFIHSHRIDTDRFPFQNTVYTVSIWDREWDELIWHDVYPDGRSKRRTAIHRFWTQATTNFLPAYLCSDDMGRNTADPMRPGSIRYKTVYHTWEQPAPPLPPPSRDTVMFVLATAMFHMNEATYQDQVVMPKTWDHVTGHRAELIPRLVFCGLATCLESEHVPDGMLESQRRFLREFGVAKRLEWLRNGLRHHITQAGWPAQLSDALRL